MKSALISASLSVAAAGQAECNMWQDVAGQKTIWLPHCTGLGCSANGFEQQCAWCVYDLSKCEAHYGDAAPCYEIQKARSMDAPEHSECHSHVTPVARHGKLVASGNRILDQSGRPTQLRGMSYFWSQWMSKYWTAESVQWLEKDWGATVVRAAMGADESDGYIQNPELNGGLLTTVVDAAIDSGIYVIIDWHSHHAEQFTNESIAFFGEMAQTYGAKPNVIFELFNEPTTQDWSTVVKPYHEAVLHEIRKHSDNLVILGTPTWSQDVDIACTDPVDDDNVAYTLHFYAGTHRQSLRDKATSALDNGCALFVTEWGTCGATGNGTLDFEETKLWTDFMDTNYLSSANWAVSDKHESCSALQADANAAGGWVPAVDGDLTYSGLYVRDYVSGRSEGIQCDGEGWPCVAPLCSDSEGECLATKCCGAEGYTCFAKDNWWAQCMRSCGGPGQEDWSCDVLAPEALVV